MTKTLNLNELNRIGTFDEHLSLMQQSGLLFMVFENALKQHLPRD